MSDEVLIHRDGSAGFLSLNRPTALHALTLDMVRAMTEALLGWRDDPAVAAVLDVFPDAELESFPNQGA